MDGIDDDWTLEPIPDLNYQPPRPVTVHDITKRQILGTPVSLPTPLYMESNDDPSALRIRLGLRIVHENSRTGVINRLESAAWQTMNNSSPCMNYNYEWSKSKGKYLDLWRTCEIYYEEDKDGHNLISSQDQ